jgi:hypothetical protein
MIETVKQWLLRNPYSAASVVFLALAMVGWVLFGWGERQFGLLLLLYFIVTLGIRLDEISRTLGGGRSTPADGAAEEETVIDQLREIKDLLAEMKAAQAGPPARAPGKEDPPPGS